MNSPLNWFDGLRGLNRKSRRKARAKDLRQRKRETLLSMERLEDRAMLAPLLAVMNPAFNGRANLPDFRGYYIVPGDDSPSVQEGTEFGPVTTSTKLERKFVIEPQTADAGKQQQPPTIERITITGSNASDFSTERRGSELYVFFTPSSTGEKLAVVTITAQNIAPYAFTVHGTGIAPIPPGQPAPIISVVKNIHTPKPQTVSAGNVVMDFGSKLLTDDFPASNPENAATYILNTGNKTLQITDVTLSNPDDFRMFTLSSTEKAIAGPRGSTQLWFLFEPKQKGRRESTVTIFSDDPKTPQFSFKIVGTGELADAGQIEVLRAGSQPFSNHEQEVQSERGASFGTVVQGTDQVREFVIKNVGDADLTINKLEVFGNSKFSISRQPDRVIRPGSSSTFAVRLDSTAAAGRYQGTIRIDSNSRTFQNGAPEFKFQVAGEIAVAKLEVLAPEGGTVFDTATKTVRTFVLKNVGTMPLKLAAGAVQLNGEGAKYFQLQLPDSAPGSVIPANGTVNFTVTYLPNGRAEGIAIFQFSSDLAASNLVTLQAQTTLADQAWLTFDWPGRPPTDSKVTFREYARALGQPLVTKTVTLENRGQGVLNVTGISISGASAFRLPEAIRNFRGTIAPGEQLKIDVQLDTTSFSRTGEFNGSLVVASNAVNGQSLELPLAASVSDARQLMVVSTMDANGVWRPLDSRFGSVALSAFVGAPAKTIKFKVQLDPKSPFPTLELLEPTVQLTTSNANEFKLKSSPPKIIPAGGAEFEVDVRALQEGRRSARLKLETNALRRFPVDISLELTGLPVPAPMEIRNGDRAPIPNGSTDAARGLGNNFETAIIGDPAVTKTYTIVNRRTESMRLTGSPRVAISGPNAADFTVTAQPADSIATFRNTTFTIAFAPQDVGKRTATITIDSDTPGLQKFTFTIEGTGKPVDPKIEVLGPNDKLATVQDATAFGLQTLGVTSSTQTFRITNFNSTRSQLKLTGTPLIKITGPAAGDFEVTRNPESTILVDSSFDVKFTPTAAGDRRATIEIATNDPKTPTYQFSVSGRAITQAEADRVLDISGLRFIGEIAFTKTFKDNGQREEIFTSASPVEVGFIPAANETFVARLKLPAGARIVTVGGNSRLEPLGKIAVFDGDRFVEIAATQPVNQNNATEKLLALDINRLIGAGAPISNELATRFDLGVRFAERFGRPIIYSLKPDLIRLTFSDANARSRTSRVELGGNYGFKTLDDAGFVVSGDNLLQPTDNGFVYTPKDGDLTLAPSNVDSKGLPTPITFRFGGAPVQTGYSSSVQTLKGVEDVSYQLKIKWKSDVQRYFFEGNLALNVAGLRTDIFGTFQIFDGNIDKPIFNTERMSLGGFFAEGSVRLENNTWKFAPNFLSTADGSFSGAVRSSGFDILNGAISPSRVEFSMATAATKFGFITSQFGLQQSLKLEYDVASTSLTLSTKDNVAPTFLYVTKNRPATGLTTDDPNLFHIMKIGNREGRVLRLENGRLVAASFTVDNMATPAATFFAERAADGRPSLYGEYDVAKQRLNFRGLAKIKFENSDARVDLGGGGTAGLSHNGFAFVLDQTNSGFLLKKFRIGNLDWESESLRGTFFNAATLLLDGPATFAFNDQNVQTLFRSNFRVSTRDIPRDPGVPGVWPYNESFRELAIAGDGFSYFVTNSIKVGLDLEPGQGNGTDSGLTGRLVNGQHVLKGSAAFRLGAKLHEASLDNAGTLTDTPGIVLRGPKDATVAFSTPSLAVGGLTIQELSGNWLGVRYSLGDKTFTVTSQMNLKIDSISLPNTTATITFSLSERKPTAAKFTLSSDLTFPQQKVEFAANALTLNYNTHTLEYTFQGKGRYTFAQTDVLVGPGEKAQIKITKEGFILEGFVPPPLPITLGNVTFDATGLTETPLDQGNRRFTGSLTVTMGSSAFNLNFGGNGTAGIRVNQNNSVQEFAAQVTSTSTLR